MRSLTRDYRIWRYDAALSPRSHQRNGARHFFHETMNRLRGWGVTFSYSWCTALWMASFPITSDLSPPVTTLIDVCVCVCAREEDWQMSIRRYIFRRRTRSCRPKYPVVQLLETSGRLLAQSKHDFIEKAEPALREGSRRATALGPAPEGAPRKESVVRYTAYTYG